MENRNYVLDRVKSRSMTADEFNFDMLQAPPLLSLLSPQDINELHYIATSIKLSARPREKRAMINRIMNRRGFVFHVGGTNRYVYRYINDDRFVVKVAIDAVGINDNPAEFRNQAIFKPFVTKVFEVSPCGTVGLFEAVNPITNREEFLNVADDVFALIEKVLIGEYVLADIGTKFFMNYGVRNGFGVVLLDFPYAYPLDGRKIYCRVPDLSSPSGCCDGEIDYDDGYNFLICKKCGAQYKAAHLAIDDFEQKIRVVRERRFSTMEISVSGGTLGKNDTIQVNGANSGVVKATPRQTLEVELKPRKNQRRNPSKKEQQQRKQVVATPRPEKKPVPKTVNGVEEKKPEPAIKFFDDNPKETIKKAIDAIRDAAKQLKSSEVDQLVDDLKNLTVEVNKTSDWTNDPTITRENAYDEYCKALKRAADAFELVEDEDDYKEGLVNEDLIGFIKRYYYLEADNYQISANFNDGTVEIHVVPNLVAETGEDDKLYALKDFSEVWAKFQIEDVKKVLPAEEPEAEETKEEEEPEETKEKEQKAPESFTFFRAETTSMKKIHPDAEDSKVLILFSESGERITVGPDKSILAVDQIDDKEVDNLSIVSSKWLDGIVDQADKYVKSQEAVKEEQMEAKEMPVGVMAPVEEESEEE